MNFQFTLILIVLILTYLNLRDPSRIRVLEEHPDFFIKAAESINDYWSAAGADSLLLELSFLEPRTIPTT